MSRAWISFLRWANWAFFAAMVALNAVANYLPLGGITTGGVSEKYPSLFTPEPFTFAIWGAIYLWMLLYLLYQSGVWSGRARADALVARMGLYLIAGCAANIAWLFCWHYDQIALSVLLMFALLATLVGARGAMRAFEGDRAGRLLAAAPFGLYFGWITVASIANVSTELVKLGWNGWGLLPEAWTVIALILGLIIAGAVVYTNRDWAYGVAVVWAYAGIIARHAASDGYNRAYPAVVVTATLAALALAVLTVIRTWRRGNAGGLSSPQTP